MFPLSTVLFPHAPLPLHVFEPRYQALVADCLRHRGEFGVVLIARGSEVGGGDQRVDVGTLARIERAFPLPGGRWNLLTRGTHRIRVVEWLPDDPYPVALVEALPSRPLAAGPGVIGAGGAGDLEETMAVVRRFRALLSETGRAPALAGGLELDADPEVATWQACALAPVTPFDAQRLLEIDDTGARLAELAELSAAWADDLSRLLADGGA